ncbi:pre-mRNA splicing regulator USH1G isoform X2 [Parasteatoda tepidariorum]|nr:Usher syndrome type-1G protein homolog isoform X2 [Parasteatoda tepidariorum]
MNCVSFLVNFGVSLWALDNDFHTASNVAAMNQRDEIIRYLDDVVARQSALNKKLVQKLKEKSVIDTEKRIKQYQKLQRKAAKRAEKEEKEIEKQRRKLYGSEFQLNGIISKASSLTLATLKRDCKITYASPKYSDIISNGAGTTKKGLGAVSKRIQQKKQHVVMTAADFKVRETELNGKRSIRSLSGLLRDSEVLYVPKYDTQSTTSGGNNHRRHMKDVFDTKSELSRAISEPDFLHTTDSGFGDDVSPLETAGSIFERPGFGSVAFRNSMSGTLMSLPSTSTEENDDESDDDIDSMRASEKDSDVQNGSVEDSIGSAGSLAQRNNHPPWEDDEGHFDDEEGLDATPLVVFLVAHGLMEYTAALAKEKIDLEALMLLTEEDLKDLGLPLGPRRKLAKAIEDRKMAIVTPGDLMDSKL